MSLIYGFLRLSQAGFCRFFPISRGCERYPAQTPQYKGNRGCDITPQMHETISGGETGIRTLGGSHLNGFQDRRIRPLCHLSVGMALPVFRHERKPKTAKK